MKVQNETRRLASSLPGPRGRILTTWKFMKDPYTSYRRWKEKYGETFLVKALNGDVVATCNQELIRCLYGLPHESIGTFAPLTTRPLVGGQSVILAEGATHRRERSLMMPLFRGEEIDRHLPHIEKVAERVGRSWEPGQTIHMMDASLEVSLEVIIRIVFGVQKPKTIETYLNAIKDFVSGFHPTLAFSRLLHRPLLGLSPWNRFVRVRKRFFDLLDEEIQKGRQRERGGTDILSRLLQVRDESGKEMSNDWIRDQLVTMLLAGHETTQIAIAWAMSWLHRNDEILQQLKQELRATDSLEAATKNPLLHGVCQESLRLNPIVADIIRVLREPMESAEFRFEKGTAVAVSIYLVHMDEEIYEDAAHFRPSRWLGQNRKPTEMMPFGGGVRRCLGATLAMLEMKTALTVWLSQFDFQLPEDLPKVEPVIRRNITMAPGTGIPLVLKKSARKNMEV